MKRWLKLLVRKEIKDMDSARCDWKNKQTEITQLEEKLSEEISNFVMQITKRINKLKQEQEDLLA